MPSGVTNSEILRDIRKVCVDQYRKGISGMLKGKQLELAVSAFEDGFLTCVRSLVGMSVITVLEITSEIPEGSKQ